MQESPKKIVMVKKKGGTDLELQDMHNNRTLRSHGSSHKSREAFKYFFRIVEECLNKGMTHYYRMTRYLISLRSKEDLTLPETERKPLVSFIGTFLERQWAKRVMKHDAKLFSGAIKFLFNHKMHNEMQSLIDSYKFLTDNQSDIVLIIQKIANQQNDFIDQFKKLTPNEFINRLNTQYSEKASKEVLATYIGLHPDSLKEAEWTPLVLNEIRHKRKPYYFESGHAYNYLANVKKIENSLAEMIKVYKSFEADPIAYFKNFNWADNLSFKTNPAWSPERNEQERKNFIDSKNQEIKIALDEGDAVKLYDSFVNRNDGARNMLSSHCQACIEALINRCIDLELIQPDITELEKTSLQGLKADFRAQIHVTDTEIKWEEITNILKQLNYRSAFVAACSKKNGN